MSSNLQQVNNAPLHAGIPVCILAVIALAARFWARKLVKYPYDAADFTLILGWLWSVSLSQDVFPLLDLESCLPWVYFSMRDADPRFV